MSRSRYGCSGEANADELQTRFRELLKPVVEEIDIILAMYPGAPDLAPLVKHALSQRFEVVQTAKAFSWSGLTLLVCEALHGAFWHAVPGATAMEFFAAAADVFDDVEDQDNPASLWALHGSAIATNAATTLLMLSYEAALRLRQRGVSADVTLGVTEAFASTGILACAGQHRDLLYEAQVDITEDAYIRSVEMKSGSLVALACRIGALLAAADPEVVENAAALGRNLGVAAQISNDVRSLMAPRDLKSDIARRKKTLPVVYALRNASVQRRVLLEEVYGGQLPIDPVTEERVKQAIEATGAIAYSISLAGIYKNRALTALGSLPLPEKSHRLLEALLNW